MIAARDHDALSTFVVEEDDHVVEDLGERLHVASFGRWPLPLQ
jgi:hypothetical protein